MIITMVIFIKWLYMYYHGNIIHVVIITVVKTGSTNQLFDGGVDLEEHRGALLVYHRHIVTTRRSTSIPVRGIPEICVGQPPLVRTVNQTYRSTMFSQTEDHINIVIEYFFVRVLFNFILVLFKKFHKRVDYAS